MNPLVALVIAFLIVVTLGFFTIVGNSGEDTGYGTWEDIGTSNIDYDGGYESTTTWNTECIALVIREPPVP